MQRTRQSVSAVVGAQVERREADAEEVDGVPLAEMQRVDSGLRHVAEIFVRIWRMNPTGDVRDIARLAQRMRERRRPAVGLSFTDAVVGKLIALLRQRSLPHLARVACHRVAFDERGHPRDGSRRVSARGFPRAALVEPDH